MDKFVPKDPDYASEVRRNIEGSPVVQWFGFEIVAVEPGEITLGLDARPELGHRNGFFQGAIMGAMADYAGSYASYTLTPRGWERLTLDFTIKFLGPAQGSRLIGRGRVLAAGRTISSSQADITVVSDQTERLCATALVTVRHVPPRP